MRNNLKFSDNTNVAVVEGTGKVEIWLVPLFLVQPATWFSGHFTKKRQVALATLMHGRQATDTHAWLLDDELAERTKKTNNHPNRWHDTIKMALTTHKVTHVVTETGMRTIGKYLVSVGMGK